MGLVHGAQLRESWQDRVRCDACVPRDAIHRIGAVAPIRLFCLRLSRRASDAGLATLSGARVIHS